MKASKKIKNQIGSCTKCDRKYMFFLTECDLCPDCVEKYPYFLSFVEEGFVGVTDKTFGRVEVYDYHEPTEYAVDELRFLFKTRPEKDKEYQAFREKWDFQNVSKKELEEIKSNIKIKFYPSTRKPRH